MAIKGTEEINHTPIFSSIDHANTPKKMIIVVITNSRAYHKMNI